MEKYQFRMMPGKFLKAQWRIIRNGRIYYFVNVLGLAMGLVSSVFIVLWIVDEYSYEKMHVKADRICKLYKQYSMGDKLQVNPSLPMPLAGVLKEGLPEIGQALRLVPYRSTVRAGDEIFNERNMVAADPAYFQLFSFNFLQGNPMTALDEPYSLVLTKEKAIKYFGKEDVLGRSLELDGRHSYTITGVMEDIRYNTELDFDMVIPFKTAYPPGSDDDNWYSHFVYTYVELAAKLHPDSLNKALTLLMRSHMDDDAAVELRALPLKEWHLHDPTAPNPRQMYVCIFSVIAVLVLLIACINFTNVSTFVSMGRSREIGIRKINGADRRILIKQFYGETLHQTLAAFVLAMMLVELLRPQFNQLTGKFIIIPYLEPWFILASFGMVLATAFLAGSYPAILISAFSPMDAFHGRLVSGKGQARFRTFLLVFQFVIAAGLIITTLTIYRQLGYMQHKNLGFEKENLLYLSLSDEHQANWEVFREKLLQHNQVQHVCRSSSLPTSVWNIIRGLEWEGMNDEMVSAFSFLSGDFELIPTLGLEVIGGRTFNRQYPTDKDKILVNEEAVRMMGFENPVGMYILDDTSKIEIIGVIRDFHGLPLNEPIEPMIINMWPQMFSFALLRLAPGDPQAAVNHLKSVWKELYPGIPFEFGFTDERIGRQYRSETRVGRLAGAFTILSVLITCIGLFATSGHSARRREREIGIRKAMGASSSQVIRDFVGEYLRWVLLANVLAWSVSWLLMKNWLSHFAYRTQVGAGSFVMATLISLLISLLTIGWHAWKAVKSNPVDVLKCE